MRRDISSKKPSLHEKVGFEPEKRRRRRIKARATSISENKIKEADRLSEVADLSR